MTRIETGDYKKLLEAERARLHGAVAFLGKENAGSIEEELGEIGGRGDDNHLADMATATYDREFDEGLEEGAQHTVEEIDAALQRIEEGSYGTCEACGEPIGAERLTAIPWTRLCIDDARRLA
jgi:RNA polymerase-binding protein DksA